MSAVVARLGLRLLVGVILAYQVIALTDDAKWVDHSDDVIGGASEIQSQIPRPSNSDRALCTGSAGSSAPPRERFSWRGPTASKRCANADAPQMAGAAISRADPQLVAALPTIANLIRQATQSLP